VGYGRGERGGRGHDGRGAREVEISRHRDICERTKGERGESGERERKERDSGKSTYLCEREGEK
jgi:hypothetical protein